MVRTALTLRNVPVVGFEEPVGPVDGLEADALCLAGAEDEAVADVEGLGHVLRAAFRHRGGDGNEGPAVIGGFAALGKFLAAAETFPA